jgi:hypothetical protein
LVRQLRWLRHASGCICGQQKQIVNDRGSMFTEATFEVGSQDAWAFLAKNKATLLAALKACPTAMKVVCKNGGIGLFTGSYDHEKVGAWLDGKITGAKSWNEFKQSDDIQSFKDRGFTKTDYLKAVDRQRIEKRAYFMVVTAASAMRNNKHHIAIHETETTLASLPGFLSGKLGRQEAVDKLFDELLIS